MNIFLGGGGNANDATLLDRHFAKTNPKEGKTAFIPIALNETEYPYPLCFEMFNYIFEPLGINNINMWIDLSKDYLPDIYNYSSIFLGGGNTFKLLHEIKKNNFEEVLRKFIKMGRIIYGNSAGAIILGKNILTAAHLDKNEVNLTEFHGMNLFNNYSLWCHYKKEDDPLVFSFIKEHKNPVLAIPEKSGIWFREGEFKVIGFESCYSFSKDEKKEIKPWHSRRTSS